MEYLSIDSNHYFTVAQDMLSGEHIYYKNLIYIIRTNPWFALYVLLYY
jgi:hypothetical protein